MLFTVAMAARVIVCIMCPRRFCDCLYTVSATGLAIVITPVLGLFDDGVSVIVKPCWFTDASVVCLSTRHCLGGCSHCCAYMCVNLCVRRLFELIFTVSSMVF